MLVGTRTITNRKHRNIELLNMSLRIELKKLWFHIGKRRQIQLVLILILMIIVSFVEIFSIGAVFPFLTVLASPERVFQNEQIKPIIDYLNINNPDQLIEPIALIFMIGVLVSGLARMILIYAQTKLGFAIGRDLSINIYRKILYQSYSDHIEKNSSEIITSLTEKVNSVTYGILIPILNIISSGIILLIVLAILLMISIRITISTFIGFGLVYYAILCLTRNRMKYTAVQINKKQTKIIKLLQESLGGIRDVIIDGTQEVYCKEYFDTEKKLKNEQARVQILSNIPRYGIEAFGLVILGIVALVITKKDTSVEYLLPILGMIALGAQRILPIMQQSYASWTYIRASKTSFSEALHLLDKSLPNYIKEEINPLKFNKEIKLKNIHFRYYKNSKWILENISININKGCRLGIVGETGSGKSTLTDIIMSLFDPEFGTLEIDDVVVTKHNRRNWQCHIAHVPQAVYLIDATITENIALGVPIAEIDIDRVIYAAKIAKLSEFIDLMPDKYNSIIGERGVKLSGGQRQRVGIARALYKKSDVIIFDEATSALDNETEREVIASIENMWKELTVIMIAHRITTLKYCDLIVELKNGKINRVGSYEKIFGK